MLILIMTKQMSAGSAGKVGEGGICVVATNTHSLGMAAGPWHCPQEHRDLLAWFSCVALSEHLHKAT